MQSADHSDSATKENGRLVGRYHPGVTLSRSARDQDRLVDYVRQALQRMDAGAEVDPVELCKEDPHLVRPLAEVLGLAADLPGLQQEALREDPLAGLVLAGRYRLEDCLGRGAMGVVYRSEDQELQRAVAIKILDARLFRDDQAEQRFQREAEALAALQHASVVTVHDRGRTAEGIHFLVMDLLEGATMSALLAAVADGDEPHAAIAGLLGQAIDEPYWPRLCARWGAAIANGLAAAHAGGLVHRDVKPSNVFVRRDGTPVLLDFGIAARASSERLTATQTTLGTPWYMPPEQVRAGAFTVAAPTLDVYGLGATLYHLLAGRPPYEGEAAEVLAKLQTEEPTPLSRVAPDLPRDLIAIVEHCLERDPARRYPSAGALLADLEAFLRHRPVTVRPLSPLARRLRAWRRAPAKPIAFTAVAGALLIFLIALPIAREQQRIRFEATKNALYRKLPSVLAIEGWPDQRVLAALHPEHRTAIAQLDQILALDAGDVAVRLFRAALRLDLDDRDGAASDLHELAAHAGGAYLQQLAARYLAADPEQVGSFAIDTSDLPEPQTPHECYVAGFHELRARHVRGYAERADALLARAADSYLPARDLRLLSLAAVAERRRGEDQRLLLDYLYDETVRLEVEYGGATARTQAMRGVALILQQNYAESVPCFLRSLDLRPDRHGPHQNLGIAYLRLSDLARCQQHLDRALELRPFAWNTKDTYAKLEQERGDFEAAYAWAAQIPTDDPSCRPWWRSRLIGNIATDEAIVLRQKDRAASHAAARKAVAAFDAVLAIANSKVVGRQRQLALALQSKQLEDAIVDYARYLLDDDPDGARELRNLAFLMPKQLGETETAWLAALLRRLAANRAGGNVALRNQLEADIDELLRPYR